MLCTNIYIMFKKKEKVIVEVPKGKRKRHRGIVSQSSETINQLALDKKMLIAKKREDRKLGKIE
jgi:hypothetical protein